MVHLPRFELGHPRIMSLKPIASANSATDAFLMVCVVGIEPTTSPPQTEYSTNLNYTQILSGDAIGTRTRNTTVKG